MIADAVYFLLGPGWRRELRSNRWHYARRWARELPVTLVQPEQTVVAPRLETAPERRIPRARSLYVAARAADEVLAGQVLADCRAQRVERPILWAYNPDLLGPFAAVRAALRIYHASDNFFDAPFAGPAFRARLATMVRISDLVIAVSDGVAAAIEKRVPDANVVVVTNGCDYHEYARGRPDPEIAAARGSHERIAVYAGNVNSRLDFELLIAATRSHRDTLFAFFGPSDGMELVDRDLWRRLQMEPNVRAFGPVDPERLPDIYAASDVGLIPYRTDPLLVDNGFPLKTLEMAATGLPVVTTPLRMIERLARGIVVTTGGESFVDAIGATSRETLSAADRDELERVCRRHDYDEKFATVRSEVDALLDARVPERRVGELPSLHVPDDVLISAWKLAASTSVRARIARSYRLGSEKLPGWVRRPFPARLRATVRRRFLGT